VDKTGHQRRGGMRIDKKMKIEDVVQSYPETISVFSRYGVACVSCSAASYDNIEVGARVHGIDIDQLLADLNATIIGRN
jgi:hybrid cluster-associated redox disulfide protein